MKVKILDCWLNVPEGAKYLAFDGNFDLNAFDEIPRWDSRFSAWRAPRSCYVINAPEDWIDEYNVSPEFHIFEILPNMETRQI